MGLERRIRPIIMILNTLADAIHNNGSIDSYQILTSIQIDTTKRRALNVTRAAYFVKPWYLTRRFLTLWMKKIFNDASTKRIMTLDVGSQPAFI
jgi:hypothetical protein